MSKQGRVVINWTQDRVALLASGKAVYMTQNGIKYLHTMQVTCCSGMKELLSTPTGRRLSRGMKVCPYCKKERIKSIGPTAHPVKSLALQNAMLGRRRIYAQDGSGKWNWSKREPEASNVTPQ